MLVTPIEGVERGIGLDGYSELVVSPFSDNLCCCEMKRRPGRDKEKENVVKRGGRGGGKTNFGLLSYSFSAPAG